MDALRKLHNREKLKLIRSVVGNTKDLMVLDVGCGRGGDMGKWAMVYARVDGIDPDKTSIEEANRRVLTNNTKHMTYTVCDITQWVSNIHYDIVCYNFSLQYIFKDLQTLSNTVDALERLVRPGGVLMGVVPDADKIVQLPLEWTDRLGNTIRRGPSTGKQLLGEYILVKVADGPYYAQGEIPEPLCYKQRLVNILAKNGFVLELWTDFVDHKTDLITDVYSKFIFRKQY